MQFAVRALDTAQGLVSFVVEATDEASARAQLQQHGVTAISVSPHGGQVTGGARTRFPLLLFAQELHALLAAGLSVIESLDLLIEKEKAEMTRTVLQAVAVALRHGERLSAALSHQPQAFPALFVGILQAAEGTSDLPGSLARYVDYETRLAAVKQKVVSAAIYPVILVAVGGVVTAFLLGYVVPRFAQVYRGSGRPLPWASQLLLDWGAFAGAHGLELGLAIASALGYGVWRLRRHLRDGAWWRMLSIIPGTRPRFEVLEVSRFYLTLGMLLQGGLPVATGLQLARSVLPADRRSAVDQVSLRITEGESLSDAFARAGLSTSVAERLLKVGERSGQLGAMLLRTAEFHEGETSRWIERFAKAFEPALMAAIGIVVGLIVILLYMPVFDLAGSLQ